MYGTGAGLNVPPLAAEVPVRFHKFPADLNGLNVLNAYLIFD
jgi:hypothetical protein